MIIIIDNNNLTDNNNNSFNLYEEVEDMKYNCWEIFMCEMI